MEDDINIEIAQLLKEAIDCLKDAKSLLDTHSSAPSIEECTILNQIGPAIKTTNSTFIMHCMFAGINPDTVE